MCLKFHIRAVHFFGMWKKKSIFTKYLFTFPGLPNLGAKIRCAQNRYTAVQTDPKYPLLEKSGMYCIIYRTDLHILQARRKTLENVANTSWNWTFFQCQCQNQKYIQMWIKFPKISECAGYINYRKVTEIADSA